MQEQPVPEWYFNLIQYYLLPITQIVFELGLVVILFLALRQLTRLVDYLEPYDYDDEEYSDLMMDEDEDTLNDDEADERTAGAGGKNAVS